MKKLKREVSMKVVTGFTFSGKRKHSWQTAHFPIAFKVVLRIVAYIIFTLRKNLSSKYLPMLEKQIAEVQSAHRNDSTC
jgi:hypothetical protein